MLIAELFSKDSMRTAKVTHRNIIDWALYQVAWAAVMSLWGCGPADLSHQEHALKAHFEGVEAKDQFDILAARPRAIADYTATTTVLVSHQIADVMHLPYRELERAIIDAGADLLVAGPRDQTRSWVAHSDPKKKNLSLYRQKTRHFSLGQAPSSVWARDWAPMAALDQWGRPLLLDFNYLNDRPEDDIMGQIFANEHKDIRRLSVPLQLEGGNLMINRQGYCIISDRVVRDNAAQPEGIHPVDEKNAIILDADKMQYAVDHVVGTPFKSLDGHWRVRTDEFFYDEHQIKQVLRDYVGCVETYIMPALPYEVTKHVDVVMKFVDDHTILVGSIEPRRIELAKDDRQRQVARAISSHLKTLEGLLEKAGFNVVSMPMPLPQIPDPSKPDDIVVRSYVNALTLQTRKGKTVLAPRYRMGRVDREGASGPLFYDYTDAHHREADERRVRQVFEGFGYEVKFIEADALIQDFGAIHCVTMQYPNL